MDLKIYWTDFAKSELRSIFQFYYGKVSLRVADSIVEGVINHVKILSHHPKIGPVELLLKERNREFRYLVFRNYKIIYWINATKNRIDIIDVFDTRQNPEKIKRGI